MHSLIYPFTQVLTFLLLVLVSISANAQSYEFQSLNKDENLGYFVSSNLQDYDNDGDLDIIIGQGEPSGLYWLENEPTRQFPKHPIVTENISRIADVDIADFDNDGDLDYVVCMTRVDDGELAWFQRQEDDTYIKWTISTNKDFIMADVADFNGDGWMDIAAVGLINSDKTARVYFNQQNLFFTEEIVATGKIYSSIDAEDIDNDGDIDIAVGGSGTVHSEEGEGARILFNNGQGDFVMEHYLHCWGDSYNDCGNRTIRIVDLNGDGTQDIMGFSLTGTGGLYWLDGSNDFDQIRIDDDDAIDLGGDFVVFDVDDNGLLDIVRQGYGQDRVSVLYQTSPLSFEREYIEINWNSAGNPTAKMSVGDLDQDGDLDLIFPEKGNVDDDLAWFENINGKLYRHYIYSQLSGARIPKFVDIDRDGDLDVVVTVTEVLSHVEENEVILFENLDGTNFINWRVHEDIDYPTDVEPADVDGDGDPDLVVTARDADDLVWLENTGRLYDWIYHKIEDNANAPLGCAVADMDGDGDLDIALASPEDDKVFWYKNNGSGGFTKGVIAPLIDAPIALELNDFDQDGDMDVAVVCASLENTLTIYWNNGTQSFTQEILLTNKSARDVEIGDWNSDGLIDIVISLYATSATEPKVDVMGFLNDGDAKFTADPLLVGVEKTNGIRLGDLDGDDDLDMVLGFDGNPHLLAGIQGDDGIDVYQLSDLNRGTIYGIDIGDVNADGIPDIVYADYERDNLNLLTINCIVAAAPDIDAVFATCQENNGSASVDTTGWQNPSYQWSNGQTTQTATGLAPGQYEVTVSSENGCSAVGSVIVGDFPMVRFELEGTDATCSQNNGTATVSLLNGVNVKGYIWNTGATTNTIQDLPGGVYTVTVTDERDCELVESIMINQPAGPTVELGDDLVLMPGDSVTLDAFGDGLTYLWSTGATSSSITVLESDTYVVTVSDEQGCMATDSVTVTMTTAVSNPYLDRMISVFPNPTSDQLVIRIADAEIQMKTAQLLDLRGREMLVVSPSTHQLKINLALSNLPAGTYTLIVTTSNGMLVRKIVKI